MIIGAFISAFTKVFPCPNERKYSSAVLKVAMAMRLDTTNVWHLGTLAAVRFKWFHWT